MIKIIKFSNFRLNESSEESNKYYDRWLEVYELMKDYFLDLSDSGWYGVDKVIISRRGIWNNKEKQIKVSDLASVFSTPGVYDTSYMSEYPKISSHIWNKKYDKDYFIKNKYHIYKSGVIKEGNIEYSLDINDSLDKVLNNELDCVLDYLVRLSYLCKSIKFEIFTRSGLVVMFSGVIKEG